MMLFYQEERNRDFFSVCEQIRRENGKTYLSVAEIAKQAIQREAQSFYLLPKEFAKIIYKIQKGIKPTVKSQAKQAQYREIEKQYRDIKTQHPDYNAAQIAKILSTRKAPRFYITETRAINLYYQLLRQY